MVAAVSAAGPLPLPGHARPPGWAEGPRGHDHFRVVHQPGRVDTRGDRSGCRWVMRRSSHIRMLFAVMLLSVPLDACSSPRVPSGTASSQDSAPAGPSCGAAAGQWAWFTGGVVTINPNGTIVHSLGNDGTWSCTDNARGMLTLRWRVGGFVNQLVLSADGRQLASTDPTQAYVTAARVGNGPTPAQAPAQTDPQRPSQTASDRQEPAGGPRPLRYLVATISGNYRDSKYLGDLLGVYIALGRSAALEPGSKLAFTYAQCYNRGVNAPSFATLASACDRRLGGMEWVRKTLRMDIDPLNNPSVEVVQTSDDPDARYGLQLRTHKGNGSWTNVVGCGSSSNCARLAADLRELFARVGNEGTSDAR